jgi:hypothetical protein
MNDKESHGIIPRAIEAVFDRLESEPFAVEYSVRISFFEIYQENIYDLIKNTNGLRVPLKINGHGNKQK